MSEKKFFVTTPIYYVNAKPHIGHTYTTVMADVLARWHRFSGIETFFLTGTDEHGAKIEEKAREAGIEPKIFVDGFAQEFKKSWQNFQISYDQFVRTTDESHVKAVQSALQFMYDKGDIYLGKYEGLYCRGCEQYKNEKDLMNGLCPDHQKAPEKISEDSYMFSLSKFGAEILKKIKKGELEILPAEKKNEIISLLETEGLKDISFSRKNVKWGITLPWDEEHTAYVWADAFLNYLTGLGWDGASEVPDFFPPDVQLMSKDIIRVHATIWPAMLLSLGFPLPKRFFLHGYFLSDGQKMSKSLGNVISPEDLIAKYGVDASRYLLMSSMAYGKDGDVSWEALDEKYNADLANGLGNLTARVSNLLEKNNLELNLEQGSDTKLIADFSRLLDEYRFDESLKTLWDKIRESDEFLSAKAPWKMTDLDEIRQVLEPVAQNILNIAVLLESFMPDTAEKIINQFSASQIKKGESLFPRI